MDVTTYKATVTEAFNEAAGRYDHLGVDFFTPMGERLVELAAPGPGQSVLDVGCGRGACVFPAAARVGPQGRVVGIDIAPMMIESAVEDVTRLGLKNIELVVMDGEYPRQDWPPFDVVLGSYSVIFLPDAPQALARYVPLLRPGGRIAFTSPVFTEETFPFLPPIFTELVPRALLSNLPPEWQPEALSRRFNSWLSDAHDLEQTMARAGFTDTVVTDEAVTLRAPSGEAWVDWSHTQGMRLLWKHLPEAESTRLRAHLIEGLDALRKPGQPLTIETPVRFVTAVTPG